MRANVLLTFLLINISFLFAQKEAANWYFGANAGLNFNNKIPVGQTGGLYTLEGCASISTDRGNLLFYTDGIYVWNKRHEIMSNGSDLFGHHSSTQSAIIIPHPGNKNRYFIFTMDQAEILPGEPKDGLSYSEVDMNLNNGLGDIIAETKNKHLITYDPNNADQKEWKSSEKLTAVIHDDGKSYWVLTHFVDMFYAFKVDTNGVSETPVTTKVNENEKVNIVEAFEQEQKANVTALGYLKISPNGEKIAIAHSSTRSSRTSGIVYLYDFDSSTGKVSSSGREIMRGYYPYGVEFSPKSKKLYVSVNKFRTLAKEGIIFEGSALYQFDLEATNIAGSKKEIHTTTSELAGALQLAINGKIYRAKFNQNQAVGGTSLAAINKPELTGDLCDYQNDAVKLASGTSSRYGLPPFIASLFLLSFDYEFSCLGEETHFYITSEEEIDTWLWKFGDGSTSTEEEPYHKYANPGEYTVELITTTNGVTNKTLKKIVEIIDPVDVLDIFELIQCDSDENSEDGITSFYLQLASDPISHGNADKVDVFYYKDLSTLHDDIDNSRALSNFYKNETPDELIYAKVIQANSNCYGVSQIILNATKTVSIPSRTFVGCNLGNGTGEFDLESQKKVIINNLNLDGNTTISFYLTENNAKLGYDPISNDYISKAKSIFLRIENKNICYGTGKLVLEIYDLPNIVLEEELNICRSSFPIRINAGIASNRRRDFTFEWESGANSHELEIYDAGEFNVLITNKATGCDQLRTIRVNNIIEPEIQEIVIEDNLDSYTATIRTNEESGLLYSLNTDFGIHRNDPVFTDLAPGVYTAYVTDPTNCYTVEKQFYIFGFPKFFTPNNDGYNDYWEVKGLDRTVFTYSEVYIFDRFGKFLVKFKADADWNGTYNGKNLPPDDYWYKVTVTDQKNNTTNHSGHFSIVR